MTTVGDYTEIFVWGCPVFAIGVDLAIGLIAKSGVPLPWLRPRSCTICHVAGPLPRHWLPEKDCERTTSSSKVLLPGRRTGVGDLAIYRPDEGGELARDRGDRDGLKLAFPGRRAAAAAGQMRGDGARAGGGAGGGQHLPWRRHQRKRGGRRFRRRSASTGVGRRLLEEIPRSSAPRRLSSPLK
jgi:hypothetical protein